jgi:integrase
MRGIYEKVKGSGVKWIRYTDANRHLHREVAGTQSAAIKLLSLRKAAVLEGRKLPAMRKASVTFRELADAAMVYSKNRNRSWRHDAYRTRKVVEKFGDSPAETITPGDVESWLHCHDWGAGTRNRYRAAMTAVFKHAVRNKKISTNPLARMEWDSERDRKRIRFLTSTEEETLRGLIPPEYVPVFLFALNTGLRLSEQFGLRPEDVAEDLTYVSLRHTKNGTIRHVRLNSTAQSILEARRGQAGRIFPYGRNQIWGMFSTAVRAAGLNTGRERLDYITWHSLRHTFASRLVMAGVPLKTVSALLGHSSTLQTERNSHLAPQHEADAVEKLVRPTDTRTDTEVTNRFRIN